MNSLAEKWAKEFPNITYIPVLSDSTEKSPWSGKKGYVHQTIADDFKDLSEYDIYACGPPIMISSAEPVFESLGLEKGHLYSDSFDFAEQ
jgi:CDP-4-dehydro-6-deoxyglucose reductase